MTLLVCLIAIFALITFTWGIAARIVFFVKIAEVFWPNHQAPWWWRLTCFFAEFPGRVFDELYEARENSRVIWRNAKALERIGFGMLVASAIFQIEFVYSLPATLGVIAEPLWHNYMVSVLTLGGAIVCWLASAICQRRVCRLRAEAFAQAIARVAR